MEKSNYPEDDDIFMMDTVDFKRPNGNGKLKWLIIIVFAILGIVALILLIGSLHGCISQPKLQKLIEANVEAKIAPIVSAKMLDVSKALDQTIKANQKNENNIKELSGKLTTIQATTGNIGEGGGLWITLIVLGIFACAGYVIVRLWGTARFWQGTTHKLAGAVKNTTDDSRRIIKSQMKIALSPKDRKRFDKDLQKNNLLAQG